MSTILCARTLAFTFLAPTAALLPVLLPPRTGGLSPAEAGALNARFAPSLGALRAGAVDAPAPFTAHERSELSRAQENSVALDTLRGGYAPSSEQWTWILVGAVVVLLIVLL